MNIEWTKLRPLNGDIKNGFEELVCQLARAEEITDRVKFTRVGAPDGGVEAYIVLKNGDEYGWQAKFFSSMDTPQWTQLDKSFKKAFATHPKLTKYFVCIPLDRQDPRIQNEKWFMDKWNEKVGEWEQFSISNGRKIEFEYWGNSEIVDRLSRPINEGKQYYWFGQEEFSDAWFKQRLEESILNLDKRYTPELNFELPIVKIFDGLARDQFFKGQLYLLYEDLLKAYNKAISRDEIDDVKDLIQQLKSIIKQFRTNIESIDFDEITYIDYIQLNKTLEACSNIIDKLISKYYQLDHDLKAAKKEAKKYTGETNTYGWEIEYLRKLEASIYNFTEFLNGATPELSNNPFLILKGEAGKGKSHLLADIAKKRESRNQFTILLLGQQFSNTDDPWAQIRNLLQINCQRDTFLSALNSKAEATGARILIFIDAINEGQGKVIWKDHIASFIAAVKRFPNLGLVFSLRTSYEPLLIPDVIASNKLATTVEHHGFESHEYEASKLFFENYKIEQPTIPLLHPEFSNPLFLKLFCEGLYKKGLHKIPDGYEGISTVINFYLDAINDRISDKYKLPRRFNIVQKVVSRIAEAITETNNSYLKFDDAFTFIIDLNETKSVVEKSEFFQDLISEGLLTQNIYWDKDGSNFEGIYITYERFSDHLRASQLLAKFLNKDNPKDFAVDGQPNKLFELFNDEYTTSLNKGIIEALSIQIPEQVNYELYEIVPHAAEFYSVAMALVESIIWRKKESLDEKLVDYINKVVLEKYGYHDYFLNTLLLVTSNPQHHFNSDFLHNHLIRFTMADRDTWWMKFIHPMYPGHPDDISPIKRMIDWAWTDDNRVSISDESIRLLCQTMVWFLTSCNRSLRDCATKAIICLLQERIHVLMQIIKAFESVNDPYVLQRVYAIAYGCAIRTSNRDILKPLGDLIYELVFNTDTVYPDILLRDYAKGIIDFAVYNGHKFDFDLAKIKPPFKSKLPSTFPTNEETDQFKFDYNTDNEKYKYSQNSILSSMVTEYGRGTSGYGDFGRYVFQSALSDWRVDVNGLSNLAVKFIIEKYGYDVEKHGKFDRSIGYSGRHTHREERIGKKYQWIAFYELLAKVSDNYPFYEDAYSSVAKQIKYVGPWQPYVRDIDPTITIKGGLADKATRNWWNPIIYSNWGLDNKVWVAVKDDLPNIEKMVSISDPQGIEWLVLEMFPEWDEPAPFGEENFESPQKRLFYNLSSHLVHKKDMPKIIDYLSNRNLRDCGLSESKTSYEMFSREYYWADANNTFRTHYYGGNHWDELFNSVSSEYICDVSKTAIQYLWEEEYDASKEEAISFYKPSEFLFKLLDLRYSNVEGHLLNQTGELVCLDPSAATTSIKCLLVKKYELQKVLKDNELEIFWTSVGEKLIIGGNFLNHREYVGRLNISDFLYFENDNLKHTTYYEME